MNKLDTYNPLISVVIPTYNREDLLTDTVVAVLRQSYRNIEVIVVSDGSSDNTRAVIERMRDDRLRYIQMNENSGLPAVVRNVGIKISKGDFLAFCDDDDLWLPRKLEFQIKEFQKDGRLLGVATNMLFFPHCKLNSYFLVRDRIISYQSLLEGAGSNPLGTSTVLLRKEVLEELGMFDEDFNIRGFEDFDLWLRILRHRDSSIKLLKNSWVKYRIDNSKLTQSESFELQKERAALNHIFRKHLPTAENQIRRLNNDIYFRDVHHYSNVSRQLYFGKRRVKDILQDEKLSFRKKYMILIKYWIKQLYFYSRL